MTSLQDLTAADARNEGDVYLGYNAGEQERSKIIPRRFVAVRREAIPLTTLKNNNPLRPAHGATAQNLFHIPVAIPRADVVNLRHLLPAHSWGAGILPASAVCPLPTAHCPPLLSARRIPSRAPSIPAAIPR